MATIPKTGEQTGKQVVIRAGRLLEGLNLLGSSSRAERFNTYRQIRQDPTIAMARALSAAPIISAEWSVEADDDVGDEAVKWISDQFLPIRESLVDSAMFGGIDFGHAPFEKVFAVDESGRIGIRRFKPLLQDITEILTTETGAFAGFRQNKQDVPLANCLLIPFRVEGTDWEGQSLMETVRKIWEKWEAANAGADRYDKKLAGSHFVVGWPDGESFDQNGQLQANYLIAERMLQALESSGSIAFPTQFNAALEGLNQQKPGWDIRILEDSSSRQPGFVERLRYLDSLKVRAMLLPERAVTEGQHGTLAESGAQIDFALTHCDLMHRHITRLINWHAVDQLLALNWGEAARGKVRLVAAPIVDAKLLFLREVYRLVLANPSGFLGELGMIDTDALKDALGVPKAQEVAQPDVEPPVAADVSGPLAATVRRMMRTLKRNGAKQGV